MSKKKTNNLPYEVRGTSRYGKVVKHGKAPTFAKAKRIADTIGRLWGQTPRIFNNGVECIH